MQSLRNDEHFSLFWQSTLQRSQENGVSEPLLPRRCKAPRRFEIGESSGTSAPTTPEQHYKVIYFEALDTIVGCIKNRFEQEGYAIYRQLEDILVTNTSEEDYEDKVRDVTAFYGDDFNEELLKTQPALFHTNYSTEDHKSIL